MSSKPKPFSRPTVSIGGTDKTWREATIHELAVGDLVQGKGLVEGIFPGVKQTTVKFLSEEEMIVPRTDKTKVFAFTSPE